MIVKFRLGYHEVKLFVEFETHDDISVSSSFNEHRFFMVSSGLQSSDHLWGLTLDLELSSVE